MISPFYSYSIIIIAWMYIHACILINVDYFSLSLQELRIPDDVYIDHMTCGSAHSVAWSSIRRKIVCQLPDKIPMEFNHLQGIPMPVLRNRLILLHQFSHLFCKSLSLFGVHDGTFEGFEKLRCILLSNAKVILVQSLSHRIRCMHTLHDT